MIDVRIISEIEQISPSVDGDVAVFMTEQYVPQLPELLVRFEGRRVFGAVVPYLIRDRELIERGLAVWTLPPGYLGAVCPMDITSTDLRARLDGLDRVSSLVVFVDGLSPDMDRFASALDGCVGGLPVLGTGVGCKDFVQRPVVFDERGLVADHALVIGFSLTIQVAAKHGWRSFYGPLVVTAARDNILFELNNQPAFSVYQRAIAGLDGVQITPENFLTTARRYPLGIATFQGDEVIVRDPIAANPDGSMTIVSSVKAMDTLYIMKGDPQELIAASSKLAQETFASVSSRQAILFDCISRVLFLEDEYQLEISGVMAQARDPELTVFGITSIGEITNVGLDAIKILNKTTLLGVVEHA